MFHDQVLSLLRRASASPIARRQSIDLSEVRSYLNRHLETRSQKRKEHTRWATELAAFVEFAEFEVHSRSATEVVKLALHQDLGDDGTETVDWLEASQLLKAFRNVGDVRRYCLENLLLRADVAGSVSTTALGRTLAGLTGVDAVRFLLVVETERSLGALDPFRCPLELLSESLVGIGPGYDGERDDFSWNFSELTLRRLVHLQVLGAYASGPNPVVVEEYRVRPEREELVRQLLAGDPWKEVVRAQLGDHVDAVLGAPARRTAGVVSVTRVVTHEIRNALVPARHYLDQVIAAGGTEVVRLQKAHNGIARVLKFIDELVSISEKVDTARLPIQVASLVGEAKALLDGAERVSVVGPDVLLALPREPLTRALSNVIQNALQSSSAPVQVGWTVEDTLTIMVDDAGPGVPEHLREQVFVDGFTTRPGGTGLGLAMARQLLGQMGGTVTCNASPLGGARFVIALPVEESK